MAKDMSGFMKSFAGNLGSQLGGGSMSNMGLLENILGGNKKDMITTGEPNPGQKMFGMPGNLPAANEPNFGQRFLSSMSDQLFQNAMRGYMDRGGFY